jgi:multidrug efflux pump subunit AcrB
VLARLQDQADAGRVHERHGAEVEHELTARHERQLEQALERLGGVGDVEVAGGAKDGARADRGGE